MNGPAPKRTEPAADRVVAFCRELGLSRREVGSTLLAIACNHMIACEVSPRRALEAVLAMYALRRVTPTPEDCLVPLNTEAV